MRRVAATPHHWLLGPVLAKSGMEGVFYAASGITVVAEILLFIPKRRTL